MEFKDKVLVITGSASGIGAALAERFVQEGATVVTADINPAGQMLAESLGARFVLTDASSEEGIRGLVADVLAHEGHIDIFCSNAGIVGEFGGPELPQSVWDKAFALNVMSHVWAARHVLPHMLERGGGALINTASAAGLVTEFYSAPYAASKHAAVGFAEWLAMTYGPRGIDVAVLCPEGVQTPMIKDAPMLQTNAISSAEFVDRTLAALKAGKFMVMTHPSTQPLYQFKASDHDAWLGKMTEARGMAYALLDRHQATQAAAAGTE